MDKQQIENKLYGFLMEKMYAGQAEQLQEKI